MAIAAGLVGLPNVGKSTLFNALTNAGVPAENYPFCTIDPHKSITIVPDKRLTVLTELYKSAKVIPATVQFVDIAGLVRGAASGEGLGNQFLSHIREVDLIIHVLRCFEDSLIVSTQADIDPLADFEIITTELMLKDLESVIKRKAKLEQLIKAARNTPALLRELQAEAQLLEHVEAAINNNDVTKIQTLISNGPATIPLLSAKKILIVANCAEGQIASNPHIQKLIDKFGKDRVIALCARLENELSQLPPEEAEEIAAMFDIKERGTEVLISKAYAELGLITFFTCGPKEAHAWPIKKGITIRQAAGEIHSDLEKGFICAEIFNYEDIIIHRTESKLKEVGKIRTEGQDYIVRDGDIVNIRFNV